MFEKLENSPRLLIHADLQPVQGHRFQPTGFPDLGAATYELPDGTPMLLVESAQSVANRLEATIVGPDNEIVPELAGVPYVKAKLHEKGNKGEDATFETTNSLIEAHRLNSPFIISDKGFQEKFLGEAGDSTVKGGLLDWHQIAKTIFKYDPNSILHGVFLANVGDGRIRLARAISGFIEAHDVREAPSGGVKNNPLDPTGKIQAVGYTKDVYGNVPYHRIEYTAARIVASFNLDLDLLRSYALGETAFSFLVALGLFKIRRFLDRGLRLRTACDLQLSGDLTVDAPEGFEVPSEQDLLARLREDIASLQASGAFGEVEVITTDVVRKASKNEAGN